MKNFFNTASVGTISEGMELTFLDYKGKNPDTLLRITPALADGTPIIKVETQSLNQQ